MPQKRKLDDVANSPELTRLANQIFEPKRTDGGFAARSIVCLGGLVSAPELNGRMALVVNTTSARRAASRGCTPS